MPGPSTIFSRARSRTAVMSAVKAVKLPAGMMGPPFEPVNGDLQLPGPTWFTPGRTSQPSCQSRGEYAAAPRVVGGSLEHRGGRTRAPATGRNNVMGIILLVLLLAIILGGLGFAIHILWWIALAVLVIWLVGFLVRVGEGGSRSRWYRW